MNNVVRGIYLKKSKLIIQIVIFISVFCLFIFAINVVKERCLSLTPGKGISLSNPIIDIKNISRGYTLLIPIETGKSHFRKIILVDLFGRPVHIWTTRYNPWHATLAKDGTLFVLSNRVDNSGIFAIEPGGILQKLDWNSNILWEYTNTFIHHDLTILPNGNVAVPILEKPPETMVVLKENTTSNISNHKIPWSDGIIELDQNKHVVWSWHGFKHLEPTTDILGKTDSAAEWTHMNSIVYVEHNPIDGTPAYLVSMRNINTVALIRKSDGEIIWRSLHNLFDSQHDATYLPNDHILVFDNKTFNTRLTSEPGEYFGSKVVEIDPLSNKVVWSFSNGTEDFDKAQFESPIIGGAQRLENGNTLITDAIHGHIFEISPDKKLIWDLVNPYGVKGTGLWNSNIIFKARRYSEHEIDWPEKIPSSLPWKSLQCQKLLPFL